jgi:hypothetical protein
MEFIIKDLKSFTKIRIFIVKSRIRWSITCKEGSTHYYEFPDYKDMITCVEENKECLNIKDTYLKVMKLEHAIHSMWLVYICIKDLFPMKIRDIICFIIVSLKFSLPMNLPEYIIYDKLFVYLREKDYWNYISIPSDDVLWQVSQLRSKAIQYIE